MKTLYLVRSPLLKRKKRLGLFKSKHKSLGKLKFKLDSETVRLEDVVIVSTSFTRHKKTVGSILSSLPFKGKPEIIIDSNLQDKDIHATLEFLSQVSDRYSHLIILTPRTTRRTLLKKYKGSSEDIELGSFSSVKLGISSWKEINS